MNSKLATETRGLIDKRLLRPHEASRRAADQHRSRPHSWNEADLLDALQKERIGGAALHVHAPGAAACSYYRLR